MLTRLLEFPYVLSSDVHNQNLLLYNYMILLRFDEYMSTLCFISEGVTSFNSELKKSITTYSFIIYLR